MILMNLEEKFLKSKDIAYTESAEHNLHPVGTVLLENKLYRFACTRLGADSFVAISQHWSAFV